MARTPQQYVNDMQEEVTEEGYFSLTPSSTAYNDQLFTDIKRMAKSVGVNAEAVGFKASALLAADILDHLAGCLLATDEEDREIGASYIKEATARLRALILWGETPCKVDCLDLRKL